MEEECEGGAALLRGVEEQEEQEELEPGGGAQQEEDLEEELEPSVRPSGEVRPSRTGGSASEDSLGLGGGSAVLGIAAAR